MGLLPGAPSRSETQNQGATGRCRGPGMAEGPYRLAGPLGGVCRRLRSVLGRRGAGRSLSVQFPVMFTRSPAERKETFSADLKALVTCEGGFDMESVANPLFSVLQIMNDKVIGFE
jgi:hypothetical protein